MDNELLYCAIENHTSCSYSSLYLSIILYFKAKFVSQFSPELCKLESLNMVYICRMSDYIVRLRLRVSWLLFFCFYPFFFLSLPVYYMLTLKICVGVFSEIFKARMLKLGIHMDNELFYYGIANQTPCSYSALYLSIFYPVFFVFVFRLFGIFVTVFFATYLLLLIYSSTLQKQCSRAIVRFSDSSSLHLSVILSVLPSVLPSVSPSVIL